VQPHHQRHEVEATRLGAAHQAAQGHRVVHDVGVAEPQVGGFRMLLGGDGDPRLHRPHLAHPAGGPRRGADQLEAVGPATRLRGRLCRRAGSVAALVVHQHHLQRPGVVLGEERPDALAHHLRLVACRHHGHHRGPFRRRRVEPAEALVGHPEAAVGEDQMQPGEQRGSRERHQHRIEGRHPRNVPDAARRRRAR
jgi:hypothetical protein